MIFVWSRERRNNEAMSEVLYEVSDPVATITLNRPERLNAFTSGMLDEMRTAFDAAAVDPDVVGIVVTGTGRGFSAGLDAEALQSVAGSGNVDDPPAGERKGLFSYLTRIPKPVIAVVNGVAAGGGYVLATMADIRFGGPEARFTTVFSKRGVIGEHGVTWTTPRLVGPGRALDLLWTSRMVDADEAYRIGLLEYLVDDDPLAAAQEYIRTLAGTVSPQTMADNKRMVWEHAGMHLDDSLDDMWEVLRTQFDRPDIVEGANSFLEKRPPEFPRLQP